MLGIFIMRINPQAHGYRRSFHPSIHGIISTGNVCALTPNLIGPRTHQDMSGKDGKDSCGNTKDELKVDLSGRILASGTGLHLKWSGDSDQRLYAISEHGGLRRTDMTVTTCGLSQHTVGHKANEGNP